MIKVLFLEGNEVAFDGANVSGGLRDGDDEVLHSDGRFRDDDDNLHEGGENIRVNENDGVGSHSDDEHKESDEERNDMTMSGGDGGIRSVRICDDGDDRMGNGDDEGNVQSVDDGNQDHKIPGKRF